MLFSFAANTLIDDLPSFAALRTHDLAGRCRHPHFPSAERFIDEGAHKTAESYDSMYLMPVDEPVRYAFSADDSLGALARRRGSVPSRRTSTRWTEATVERSSTGP